MRLSDLKTFMVVEFFTNVEEDKFGVVSVGLQAIILPSGYVSFEEFDESFRNVVWSPFSIKAIYAPGKPQYFPIVKGSLIWRGK